MKRFSLNRFERIAQKVMEGSFSRLLGGRIDPVAISAEVARILEKEAINGISPNAYTIQINPADYGYLRLKRPAITAELIRYIEKVSEREARILAGSITVELVASPLIDRHGFSVSALHQKKHADTTRMYEQTTVLNPYSPVRQAKAFLIQDGQFHIPLTKPLTSIGRRSDNDIVLGDPAVSRKHAQLQFRFGRFALYDLDSRIGTLVNGEIIQEFLLRSGDVVQIGQHSFIFTQEEPRNEDGDEDAMGQTQQLPPTENG